MSKNLGNDGTLKFRDLQSKQYQHYNNNDIELNN